MTQPLALVFYERLLPGSQLVNRLQDLGYRVLPVPDSEMLASIAEQEKPLVVLVDLESSKNNVCDAIARLRKNPSTQHLPVIAFAAENQTALQLAAREANATLVANESAILTHLPQFLEQALQVE